MSGWRRRPRRSCIDRRRRPEEGRRPAHFDVETADAPLPPCVPRSSATFVRPAGLILAGGRGTRMGGGTPKPLRLLSDRPLIAHVADRLRGVVDPLLLNANDAAAYEAFGLPVVPDLRPGFQGPLAGIETGLAYLAHNGGPDRLLTLAGDTPFLPKDILAHFPDTPDRPVVARHRGRLHPTVGLWPVAVLFPAVRLARRRRQRPRHPGLSRANRLRHGRRSGRTRRTGRRPLLQRQHAGRSGDRRTAFRRKAD